MLDALYIILLSIVFLLIYVILSGIIKALICYMKELKAVDKSTDHLKSIDAFYATPWDDKDNQKDFEKWKKKSL